MNYFDSPETLDKWVKNNTPPQKAIDRLLTALGDNAKKHEQDVTECCEGIHKNKSHASNVLFNLLSKYGITSFKKESNMKGEKNKEVKTAQTSRPRNKWNRSLDGFNEGTPWRIARDKMYDFTHYYSDAISFDEDPERVYSGEALWRMYVMDKYTREYQDENGKWVGGYINDRFHVFPDAGTPANPGVPRDGGNQMQLAQGERTRKPRPHEYSYERRLEEQRGNKLKSIEVTASSFNKRVKVSSNVSKLPEERNDDVIYNVFTDCLDMREAGIEYKNMITKVADHYNLSLLNVAQIDREARKLKEKHEKIGYEIELKGIKKKRITANVGDVGESSFQVVKETNVFNPMMGNIVTLQPNEFVVLRNTGDKLEGQVIAGENAGLIFQLDNYDETAFVQQNMPAEDVVDPSINQDADELGLNEDVPTSPNQNINTDNNLNESKESTVSDISDYSGYSDGFDITDMSQNQS